MKVAVNRLYSSGRTSQKPLVIFHARDLDDAEAVFNDRYRRKYPENYNFEYVDLDANVSSLLKRFGLVK